MSTAVIGVAAALATGSLQQTDFWLLAIYRIARGSHGVRQTFSKLLLPGRTLVVPAGIELADRGHKCEALNSGYNPNSLVSLDLG